MEQEKIAILTESGSDLPEKWAQRGDVFVVPLRVLFEGKEYKDDGSLNNTEIQKMLDAGAVKTSLPTGADIMDALDQIKAAGFKKVFVITLSSGLSGVHNFFKLICQDYKGLEFEFLDTKNIGIGSGISAIYALQLIDSGAKFKEVVCETKRVCGSTTIYFCLMTLEYLRKGGRIGLVDSIIGNILKVKPVISCNEDGIYYTVSKKIGYTQALEEIMRLVCEKVKPALEFNIVLAYGEFSEKVEKLKARLKELLPHGKDVILSNISSALTVHTGLSVIGVGVQLIK